MKKTNPSKVIIIPQTPQNNSQQVECPQCDAPTENKAPVQPSVQQEAEAEAEPAEEEAE